MLYSDKKSIKCEINID